MYEKLLRHIVLLNQWRKKHISQDNFLIIAAAIVGSLGGLAASLLKLFTHWIAGMLGNGFGGQNKYYIFFFLPVVGFGLTVLYLKVFIRKHKFNRGIPPLIRSITKEGSKLDFHNSYSQLISSGLTVGFGGSAGLESPSVASGASLGSNFGRLFGLNYRETSLLLACGGGAGIAGAFNSPVAGMLFAMEVLLPSVSIPAIIPLLIASAFASVVSTMVHSEPLFAQITGSWTLHSFWYYILFAVVAGLYSVYFSWLDDYLHKFFDRMKSTTKKLLIGGLGMGLLITLFPAIYGEGYGAVQKLLDGNYQSLLQNSLFSSYSDSLWILFAFGVLTLLAKTLGSVLTLRTVGNGGMFGPSVGVGGLLGFLFAFGLNQTGWVELNVTDFMVAGMATSVSGLMHAPLTGVFLAAEITGGYTLLVPLMLVSAISFFINKAIRKYSIYTRVLAEEGNLVRAQTRDTNVLDRLKLKFLIETDYVILKGDDTAASRGNEIIHSDKTVFPVVNSEGQFLGILNVEDLLEHIVDQDSNLRDRPFAQLVQPTKDVVQVGTAMGEVMQFMDKRDTRTLPVVDAENHYLGFVTKNGIFTRYRSLLQRRNDLLG